MDAVRHIEGLEIPVHHALTAPIPLGAVPCAVVILNGTLAAAIGIGLQQWIAGIGLFVAGHTLAVLAARCGSDFHSVLVCHLRQREWRRR